MEEEEADSYWVAVEEEGVDHHQVVPCWVVVVVVAVLQSSLVAVDVHQNLPSWEVVDLPSWVAGVDLFHKVVVVDLLRD